MNVQYEKRLNQRMPYLTEVFCHKYYCEGKEVKLDKSVELMVYDISVGGLGAISKTNIFSLNDMLTFNLRVNKIPYDVLLKVVWIKQVGEHYKLGLEFINIPNSLFKSLKKK